MKRIISTLLSLSLVLSLLPAVALAEGEEARLCDCCGRKLRMGDGKRYLDERK